MAGQNCNRTQMDNTNNNGNFRTVPVPTNIPTIPPAPTILTFPTPTAIPNIDVRVQPEGQIRFNK